MRIKCKYESECKSEDNSELECKSYLKMNIIAKYKCQYK